MTRFSYIFLLWMIVTPLKSQTDPCPNIPEVSVVELLDTLILDLQTLDENCSNLDSIAHINYWWKFTVPSSKHFEFKGFPSPKIPYLRFFTFEANQMKHLSPWSKITHSGILEYNFINELPAGQIIYFTPAANFNHNDKLSLAVISDCPNYELIDYRMTADRTISRSHSVIALDQISEDAMIEFSAQDSIIMKAGFEVETGSSLIVSLNGCQPE